MVTQTRQAKIPLPRRDFIGTMKPRKLTFPRQTGPFSSERMPHLPDTPLGDTMTTIPMPLMNKLMTQSPTRKLLAIAICGLGTLSVTTAPVYADDDGSFWTQFVPSADTRLIFVSSEEGNDNNSGLNPNAPVKTLARGYELLRDGYPDWMLLKRGDVWYESFPRWNKSGREVNEKMVVGAYGDNAERPQIRPDNDSNGLNGHGTDTVTHMAFVGFHIEPYERTADSSGTGISWLKDAEDVLFEDLYIAGFKDNMILQAFREDTTLRDFHINGCVIVDSWSNNGHSQGIFAKGLAGLKITHSVFDHNGWNTDTGANPTIYNHNVYLQAGSSGVVVTNNIFSDASATGIQMRSGGVLKDNLFLNNPVAFTIGSPSAYTMENGVDASVSNNLVLYGRDLSESKPRAVGSYISNIRDCNFSSNIYAHSRIGYNGEIIKAHGSNNGNDIASLKINNNYFVDWHGPVVIDDEVGPSVYGEIDITENTFVSDMTNNDGRQVFDRPFITVFDSQDPRMSIAGNTHYHYGMHERPFMDRGNPVDEQQWISNVDSDATFIAIPAMPASLEIEDYMANAGSPGDLETFMQMCRHRSRVHHPDYLTPTAVYDWYLTSINGFIDHE